MIFFPKITTVNGKFHSFFIVVLLLHFVTLALYWFQSESACLRESSGHTCYADNCSISKYSTWRLIGVFHKNQATIY